MKNKINRFVVDKIKYKVLNREYKETLNNSGIYAIVNIINDHKYIGQSKDIGVRWKEHKYSLHKNTHYNDYLQNAWNFYKKENFRFEVLEFCGLEELNDKEQYWIERLDPEYNIVRNVLEFYATDKDRIYPDGYTKSGENFMRPKWHLWVYGGHRKSEYE